MINQEIINNYLNNNEISKLQLGCGGFPIKGWLNSDKGQYKINNEIIYLDVTKRFELPDNSFNYIYSEHLFEHLTYHEGLNMLKECYRILKPGGIIRIATPNLEFLIDLYFHPEKEINKSYIEFDGKRTNQPNDAVYAISHFHTDWGHKIIYDYKSLKTFLESVGFKNIIQCEVSKSSHAELNDIEQHPKHFKKMGVKHDFNSLQTMVLEAEK